MLKPQLGDQLRWKFAPPKWRLASGNGEEMVASIPEAHAQLAFCEVLIHNRLDLQSTKQKELAVVEVDSVHPIAGTNPTSPEQVACEVVDRLMPLLDGLADGALFPVVGEVLRQLNRFSFRWSAMSANGPPLHRRTKRVRRRRGLDALLTPKVLRTGFLSIVGVNQEVAIDAVARLQHGNV